MRKIVVLGCTLLLIAGCGGGSGNGMDGMVTGDPTGDQTEPARETTLHTTGEVLPVPIPAAETGFTAEFFNWGVWGGVLRDDAVACTAIGCPPAGDAIFWAYLTSEFDGTITVAVDGTPSGFSPVSGSAVWSGDVHALDPDHFVFPEGTSVTAYAAITGDARLEVDFVAVTVDVNFTNFDGNRADMSWNGLAIDDGRFGNGVATIDGSFYGEAHEGAAGTFERDGLTGVFGALRSTD